MSAERGLRILVLSSSLGMGGADRQILAITGELRRDGHEVKIASLTRLGSMGTDADHLGFDVCSLEARRGSIPINKVVALARLVRGWRPHLIQGWMYHANLAASLACFLAPGRTPLIWGVRHSLHDLEDEKRSTRFILRLSNPLSRLTDAVVYNAQVSVAQHERIGFDSTKSVVIPNGFDCALYHPRTGAGERLRAELGLSSSTLLLGMIARFHAQKDHPSLLRAMAVLADEHPHARLVLVGGSMRADNQRLMRLLGEHGLTGRVRLLGARTDIPEVVAGLDICVLSSAFGEGFPNVLGEAMASAVPCVATDVGDSARIIGDTGIVTPRRDPAALAAGIARLASLPPEARRELGRAARARMVSHFSLRTVAAGYAELYRQTVQGPPRPAPVRSRTVDRRQA